MLLEQPYDSKTLQNFNRTDETFLVNRYIITDYAYIEQNQKKIKRPFVNGANKLRQVILYGLSETEKEIVDLDFPIVNKEKGWICFDMRRYNNVDRKTGDIIPKTSYEVDYINTRNNLTGLWAVGLQNEMYLFTLPHLVFAKWISSLIASKIGLDNPKEESDINVLALIYYNRLFSNPSTRNHTEEKNKLAIRFKETFFNRGIIDEIYDQSLEMETLEDFCAMVHKITGNVRLNGFNVGVLLRLTQTSWIGTNYKQYLSLALEYPPIWIAMVEASLKTNAFKKTVIGDKAEAMGRRGQGIMFLKTLGDFIKIKTGED